MKNNIFNFIISTFIVIFIISLLSNYIMVKYNKHNLNSTPIIPNKSKDQIGISSIKLEIQKILSNNICKKDSDCEYLPIGYKACGGPSGYIVFSRVDIDKLRKLTSRYNELDLLSKKANKQSLGICNFVTAPKKVMCLSGKCAPESSYRYIFKF